MCCVCFFCLGFLFVWRQLCWVFNILCRFLKGWESKTARNSVLLHAECGPSQCSKLIICTERICYLKKAFQKIHKGLEIHKNPIFYSRDCCPSVLPKKKKRKKKTSSTGFGGWRRHHLQTTMGLVFGGLRLCQRIFYGLQTARGCVVPRCVRFRWAKSGGKQPTGTEPRFRTPMFLKLNGAFDSHFFPPRLSKTTISKVPSKKIPTTTNSTNIS